LRSRGKELPNDFLPGNCPAVNFPVPVIFRKAIRDRAFDSAAAFERSTVEISSFVILLVLSIVRVFFNVPSFSISFTVPSVLTAISHPSFRLGAKLVLEATQHDPIEEKAGARGEKRQGKKGVARARDGIADRDGE